MLRQHTGPQELSPMRTEPQEGASPGLAVRLLRPAAGSVTEWTPGPPSSLRLSAPSHLHPTRTSPNSRYPNASGPPSLPSQAKDKASTQEGLEALALMEDGSTFRKAWERTPRPSSPPCLPYPKFSICGARCKLGCSAQWWESCWHGWTPMPRMK